MRSSNFTGGGREGRKRGVYETIAGSRNPLVYGTLNAARAALSLLLSS